MDEYSRKRSAGGFGFSRRGSNLSFREPNYEDRSIQYCNRLGCSTRLSSMKGTELSTPEKPKYQRTTFRPLSSKSVGGSSSKAFAASTDLRKSHQQRPNRASSRDTAESSSNSSRCSVADENESSCQLGETEGPAFNPMISGIQTVSPDSEDVELPSAQRLSKLATESSASKPRKQVGRRMGSNNQDIPSSSSSVRRPVMTKHTGQVTTPSSQYLGSGPSRYGLKNLSCSSMSDVLPSGCSSSDFGHNRRVPLVRKRPSDGEGSSSGGKSSSGSSSSGIYGTNGSLMPHQGPRRARNRPLSRDGPVSVRTRRAPGGETRMRLPEQQGDNILSVSDSPLYPQLPHTQLTIREVIPESPSLSFPMEQAPIFPSSFGSRQSSNGRSTRSRLVSSHSEDISTHGPLGDRDGYRRFNMEGIAEVLLALERIEQDDELTYEQLLVLETNLFLGGFNFHDRHREMRLDIDNMTYEELLALEEKMGTVSTALSEDALAKCLRSSSFMPPCQVSGIASRGDDDVKCSICQEEYVIGDEVAKLGCDHGYHVDCIHQWLRQKNWCPICKTSAAPHAEETKD